MLIKLLNFTEYNIPCFLKEEDRRGDSTEEG